MTLVRNGFSLDSGPGVRFGGARVAVRQGGMSSAIRNRRIGWASASGIADKAGIPSGVRHPYCWDMPAKGGALASRYEIFGAGSMESAITAGRGLAASLAGASSVSAALALVVSLVASMSGTASVAAALAGIGGVSAAIAGAGSLAAAVEALGHMVAGVTGAGEAEVTAAARGHMACDIDSIGDMLTTSNVAAAVWGALAAVFDEPGTMGGSIAEILASGGSLTPDQATQLLELWRVRGLDAAHPVVVDRAAGTITTEDIELEAATVGTTDTITRTP
jgi:hypothetical protein